MAVAQTTPEDDLRIIGEDDRCEEELGGSDSEDEETPFDDTVQEPSDTETDAGDSSEDEAEPPRKAPRAKDRILGKNQYVWSKVAPSKRGRKKAKYFVTHKPGPKGDAKETFLENPLQAWELFFTEEIIHIIVVHTNEEIQRRRDNCATHQTYQDLTDVIELRALFGILYVIGTNKSAHRSTDDLWSPKKGLTLLPAAMSRLRFVFLAATLRFDDKTTRPDRKKDDNLAPIREIWDLFVARCSSLYTPYEYLTIDEQLLNFRGRCTFRMYIPSKPDRYGIKVVCMNDARTWYMVNAIVYIGKVTDNEMGEGIPEYYVRVLSTPVHHTNRNITVDNWFSTVPLFSRMLNDYDLTMVGTLKKNKREIPPSFKNNTVVGSSMFAFDKEKTLVSYAPKKNKVVILLSTMHHDDAINAETSKPEIIMTYNVTKGGTDTFDKLCHAYTTARGTRRWPMRLFFGMLDQSGVNAAVIFTLKKNGRAMKRSDFLHELGYLLAEPQLRRRLAVTTLRRSLKFSIREILGEDEPALENEKLDKPVRCTLCSRKTDRKTNLVCKVCKRPMCAVHRGLVCTECL